MFRITKHTIAVSDKEQKCIEDLMNMLDEFPLDLSGMDYFHIFQSIAQKKFGVDELETEDNYIEIKYDAED